MRSALPTCSRGARARRSRVVTRWTRPSCAWRTLMAVPRRGRWWRRCPEPPSSCACRRLRPGSRWGPAVFPTSVTRTSRSSTSLRSAKRAAASRRCCAPGTKTGGRGAALPRNVWTRSSCAPPRAAMLPNVARARRRRATPRSASCHPSIQQRWRSTARARRTRSRSRCSPTPTARTWPRSRRRAAPSGSMGSSALRIGAPAWRGRPPVRPRKRRASSIRGRTGCWRRSAASCRRRSVPLRR